MNLLRIALFNILIFTGLSITAQIQVEGYAYQSGNRGFLNRVLIEVYEVGQQKPLTRTYTNTDGFFQLELPHAAEYKLMASKEMFDVKEMPISSTGKEQGDKVYLKVEMDRSPGYVFEVTMAEKREDENIPVNAIRGALIEVYNNTTGKSELVLQDHPHPDFQLNMLKGNHYTILIRKEGFLAKRMEAYVDVEGCILCFEGIGKIEPGVSDNLTEGNQMGVLLANLEMERVTEKKTFEINNLYYDYGKWELKNQGREELNKVINIFKDNPGLLLELGSHTDSRDSDEKNMILSEKRAQSAVNYLRTYGNVPPENILAKGYGESKILNRCKNGVVCSDKEHARNRRTELKIIGEISDYNFQSLIELKEEEKMDALIRELQNQKQVKVKEGEDLDKTIKDKTKKTLRPDSIQPHQVQDRLKDVPRQKEKVVSNIVEPSSANEGLTYKIVVHYSQISLPASHQIFQDHEKVDVYISPEKYSYYLIGNYSTEAEALADIEEKWISKYPNAYLMKFRGDERVK